MGKDQDEKRFQQLRAIEHDRALTELERIELDLLLKEIEAAEAAYLTPATDRLRQERATIEEQNCTLELLTLRKEALVRTGASTTVGSC